MSEEARDFTPLRAPEIPPLEHDLPPDRRRFPGRLAPTGASVPPPITASRLEIGGTWVQKMDFPSLAEPAEEPRPPVREMPVVVKAAGESARPHPLLSPPRPVRKAAALLPPRRKRPEANRIPVLRPPLPKQSGTPPASGATATPSPLPETFPAAREAKTDPKRVARIESCFTKDLPPDPA
ncbi:MAG TPA: hypothetical protein VKT32_03580 [Chthonomonadaceae bacterium]|nr:hypothetical protein [Chthonomonadaceae bacterium]